MKYLNAYLRKSTSATKKNFPMFTYKLQSKILGQLVTANITLFFEWHLWHLGMRIRQLIKERDLGGKKKKKRVTIELLQEKHLKAIQIISS